MGTFRKRVKSKGKRWVKGQSSNSNPECSTFRKTARNNFFKEDLCGNTRHNVLTEDTLRKHDHMNSPDAQEKQNSLSIFDSEEDDLNSLSIGSVKTFNTFASDWSCCSNVSFNKLLNKFDLSSALHKEMLAVLAAVTEVIKANGGNENTTEYFAALMTTLDSIEGTEQEDSVCALLSLLAMCIKSVRRETLQLKFSTICETLTRHLKNYYDSENNVILKSIIGCLSVVLRAQHISVWKENSKTLDYYKAILEFVTHPKSKIRKAGQHAVCAILKGSYFLQENPDSLHPAAEITATHCLHVMESSFSEGGTTTVLHVLVLLKDIVAIFPKSKLKVCCNTLLQLMTLKNSIITTCSLQTLYGLFVARPNVTSCPTTLNAQLINALYDYQPAVTDSQSVIAWATVMQEALVNLAKNDLSLCISNTPKLFHAYSSAFLSEKPDVISSVTSCMQTTLKECVGPAAATESNIDQYRSEIHKIFEILKNCMKYTYHMAWKSVLYLLASFYRSCGSACSDFAIDYLRELADLRDSDEYAYENEIDNVFGAAIETIGPEKIITQIPLQAVADKNSVLSFKRSWLLPLLRQHVKNSTLQCFVKNFRPMAVFFHEKKRSAQVPDQAIAYDLLESQIWALLPTFCRSATDIKSTIPTIAKNLGDLLKSRSDLRSIILASLRNLIQNSQNDATDTEIMARFAKNYLPILFNLYTTKCEKTNDEATRVSAFETIKVYLTITDGAIVETFFNEALKKLERCESDDTETKDDFEKEAILDLLRTLIPFLSADSLSVLFDKRIRRIKTKLHFKEEKKYYRLLADICTSETDSCKSFVKSNFSAIKKLLISSESNTQLTSRGARIKAIAGLLGHNSPEKTMSAFLPEVVLCCKDGNQRCRLNAFELLNKMADAMVEDSDDLGAGIFVDKLLVGLVGTTSVISATILALSSVVHHLEDKLNKSHFGEILKNICLLSQSKTREIVGPTLGFLKVTISMRDVTLFQKHLPLIVKSLSGITKDCQRKYRQKIRDLYDRMIRKFGIVTVISLVPTHDAETMARLKAIKKEQARKTRKKLEAKEKAKTKTTQDDDTTFNVKRRPKTINEVLAECDDDDEDNNESDEDDSNERETKPSKSKRNVYLKEDEDTIIDFTSPSAYANITVSKPKTGTSDLVSTLKRKEKIEFPSAPDGRLIILDKKTETTSKSSENIESDNESIASDAEAEGRLSNMLSKVNIGRKRKNSSNVGSSDDEEGPSRKYQAGGSGIHRKISKTNNVSVKTHSGNEFKTKKASGDMKRKGKPDPYAYIPLSRNALNRRKKKKSTGQFNNMVKSAKKGANKGAKNRSRMNKKKKINKFKIV